MSLEKVTYTYRLPDNQREALEEKLPDRSEVVKDLSHWGSVQLWAVGLQKWTSHAQSHMRHVTDWASQYKRRILWRDTELIIEFIRDPA